MVQDNPKQEELHEMIKFIAQNKQIYIYMGDIILAKNISKYLYYARIQFCGFIKPEIYDCDRDSELYKFKIEVFCGYYETMTSLR